MAHGNENHYGVALDVSDLGVRQFEGIRTSAASWYVGTWTGSGTGGGWDLAGFQEGLVDAPVGARKLGERKRRAVSR